MKIRLAFCVFFIFTLMFSCGSKPDRHQQLFDAMRGHFSSVAQAREDSAYYEIHLKMKPIWPEREDGYWLYVEQSVAGWEHKPYRQRVYQLLKGENDTLISEVYELSSPEKVIGACDDPILLEDFKPDSLVKRKGCAIFLTIENDSVFVGSTKASQCPSQLNDASYATSEVKITPSQLISWDRGFDSQGNQVWGAVKGGYIFDKIRSYSY
jgi:hypothetical protein